MSAGGDVPHEHRQKKIKSTRDPQPGFESVKRMPGGAEHARNLWEVAGCP